MWTRVRAHIGTYVPVLDREAYPSHTQTDELHNAQGIDGARSAGAAGLW